MEIPDTFKQFWIYCVCKFIECFSLPGHSKSLFRVLTSHTDSQRLEDCYKSPSDIAIHQNYEDPLEKISTSYNF